MSFLAPMWLLGLVPWAAVVIWLLIGRRERASVPFLELWRGKVVEPPRARTAFSMPPLAFLLLIGAVLVAILAASRPRVLIPGSPGPRRIVILADNGFSFRASPKWMSIIEDAEREIVRRFGNGMIERVFVGTAKPNLIDTQALLPAAVQRALLDPSCLVVVITDQTLSVDDPRLIQIPPESSAANAGFVFVNASETPRPQVMARIRNDSEQKQASLKIGSASRAIDLPPRGTERNYFIDVDRLETTTRLELVVDDDLDSDNKVDLSRVSAWPRLVPAGDLPPELMRMIQAYVQLRPPLRESSPVLIGDPKSVGDNSPGILLGMTDGAGSNQDVRVDDHPITANVKWEDVLQAPFRVASPPGSEWRVIARAGEKALVAVRDAAPRRVWVGFQSDSLARSTDFVVFWTNVFDWVGNGGTQFDADGTFACPILTPPKVDWKSKLDGVPPSYQPGRDLSPVFALLSLLMIFAAALFGGLQKLRGPVPFSQT